jgi:DNA-binding LytR/AlgR family response regulator
VINTLIIEDNLGFSIEIEMLLRKMGGFKSQVATSSEEVDRMIGVQLPNLLLIDVKLKGSLNGIDIYQKYLKYQLPVVFFTAYNEEALYQQARSISNAPYLIKPFDQLTLKAAIESVLANYSSITNYFFVKKRGQKIRVPVTDIVWIEVERNHCSIHTNTEKHVLKISIKKLLDKLQHKSIVMIHRGIAVNMDEITSVDFSNYQLSVGETRLPIGKTYRKQLKGKLGL